MRPVNLKKLNYKDEMARRHRRVFVLKIVVILAGFIAVVAGLFYLLFLANIFDVREVSFNGLDTVSSGEFKGKINDELDKKIFKYLPTRNNIFFVDIRNFETELASTYPVFKSLNIRKKLFHGLVFDFLERKPVGVWCFSSSAGERCFYFDNDKVLWGQPAKSSGFIFLTIEDKRVRVKGHIDNDFFEPIMEVAKSMTGEIKNIVIPTDSFNEFRVYAADYYIIFNTDFDIKNQLDTLKIFMNDKINDPDFHPQYIDLRIDGRVYYK